MAKKGYDVAKRFQEVAKRATVHTGPSGHNTDKEAGFISRASKELAADPTRPGASMNIPRGRYGEKKDVNLPIHTGPRKKK